MASLEVNNLFSEDNIWIPLKINKMMMKIEHDTGSAVSVMAEGELENEFGKQYLKTPDIILQLI